MWGGEFPEFGSDQRILMYNCVPYFILLRVFYLAPNGAQWFETVTPKYCNGNAGPIYNVVSSFLHDSICFTSTT